MPCINYLWATAVGDSTSGHGAGEWKKCRNFVEVCYGWPHYEMNYLFHIQTRICRRTMVQYTVITTKSHHRKLCLQCCHPGSSFSAWKVVPWSAVLQLVLLCTVYIQAQGCLCTAYQLGGDVQQPCLIIKYDVIHKTGSTHVTTPPEEDRATAMAIRKTQKMVHSEPKNVPGGTDVLGKWKSVPGKIRIRASIFASIYAIPFKLIVSDASRIAIKHECI